MSSVLEMFRLASVTKCGSAVRSSWGCVHLTFIPLFHLLNRFRATEHYEFRSLCQRDNRRNSMSRTIGKSVQNGLIDPFSKAISDAFTVEGSGASGC